MLPAGHAHFLRRPEVQTATRLFLRVFLSQQRQGADGLNNIIFDPVSGCGVMNRRTRHHRMTTGDEVPASQGIKSTGKIFGNPRITADRNQPFAVRRDQFTGNRLPLARGHGRLIIRHLGLARQQAV